jgi:hypothetical protein
MSDEGWVWRIINGELVKMTVELAMDLDNRRRARSKPIPRESEPG